MTPRAPLLRIHADELIVDGFAGGGGASTGIEWALGRSPDIALNHDPEALAMHIANHPNTRHLLGNIWDTRPLDVTGGRPVAYAHFSPDCTFFSKARGAKPFRDPKSAKGRRGLAWVVTRWAAEVRPRVITIENVEELQQWGPLGEDGRPDPARAGQTFRAWVGRLRRLGYAVDWRELRAHDFGAPTIRKRLFVIARCDGRPIVWPEPTHGPGRSPYRTAAECIDWHIDAPSIFERARPLADKTLARIARGIRKFVLESASPFIIPLTHGGDLRSHGIGEPLRTVTSAHRGEQALVAPVLYHSGNGERPGQAPRIYDIQEPIGTLMAQGVKHALALAFLARHYGGHENAGAPLPRPLFTITTQDHHALVAAQVLNLRGQDRGGRTVEAPAPTITAGGSHLADVRAFLVKYNGTGGAHDVAAPLDTICTRDRFGLVQVAGEDYALADIGMRMLQPRELFRAQGFPDSYVIDPVVDGKPISKTSQIRMVGNSVPPQFIRAIVEANLERNVRSTGQLSLLKVG